MNTDIEQSKESQLNPKPVDYRALLFLVVALLFALRIAQVLPEFWWDRLPGQSASRFEDLLCITRDGENVAHGRFHSDGFLYPPACYWFGYVGLREVHNTALGITLAALFLAGVYWSGGAMGVPTAAFYFLLLCSPPVNLAIWRGNIDLLIFFLLVLVSFFLQMKRPSWRFIGYLILFYSALLKLYPIFATAAAIREKRYRWVAVLAGLAFAFGVYLFIIQDDLRQMSALAPHNSYVSYGAVLLINRLTARHPYNGKIAIALCAVVLAGVWTSIRSLRDDEILSSRNSRSLDAFRMGGAIYVACFALIQYNFMYRFVTLFLTLPQWLAWRREGGRARTPATTALALVLLAFWTPRYSWNWTQLDQVWDWALFALYSFALLESAPEEIRTMLGLKRGNVTAGQLT